MNENSNEADLRRRLAEAELRRAELENRKLERELAPHGFLDRMLQLIPLWTALVGVAGFLFGVHQFTAAQESEAKSRSELAKQQEEAAKREFMKPWLEDQRKTYSDALAAAATLANAPSGDDRAKAEQDFWRLYYGRMIVVETMDVSGSMVAFGNCLLQGAACGPDGLRNRAKTLATSMANSMAATAAMSYEQYDKYRFQYAGAAFDARGKPGEK